MSTPQGWYPDPTPPPGMIPGLRWWNGQTWTEHVTADPFTRSPEAPRGPVAPGQPPAYPHAFGATNATTATLQGSQISPATPSTPDGEELAGWGTRLGAYLIDSVLVAIVAGILGIPFSLPLVDRYVSFIRETMDTAESGGQAPVMTEFFGEIIWLLFALVVVQLIVGAIYHCLFLRFKAATPGKLALGLRVRLRETPGPLSWGTVLRRWVAQFGYGILAWIPLVSTFVSIYPLLDGLWPLWDAKRQAWHDKYAATNVVRVRR